MIQLSQHPDSINPENTDISDVDPLLKLVISDLKGTGYEK